MERIFLFKILFALAFLSVNVIAVKNSYESAKIDKKALSKIDIFDLESDDPFLGVKFKTGYLDFPKSDQYEYKSNYFLYMFNNKGLAPADTP